MLGSHGKITAFKPREGTVTGVKFDRQRYKTEECGYSECNEGHNHQYGRFEHGHTYQGGHEQILLKTGGDIATIGTILERIWREIVSSGMLNGCVTTLLWAATAAAATFLP
jgi:hypothetical protein